MAPAIAVYSTSDSYTNTGSQPLYLPLSPSDTSTIGFSEPAPVPLPRRHRLPVM